MNDDGSDEDVVSKCLRLLFGGDLIVVILDVFVIVVSVFLSGTCTFWHVSEILRDGIGILRTEASTVVISGCCSLLNTGNGGLAFRLQ